MTLESIRPFPKVIPSTGSRRPSSRFGSTRILTDSPETNKIEEDYMRKKEKENKKDAVKRRLLPLKENNQHQSNIPATRPTVKRRIQRENKINEDKADKENIQDHSDTEEGPSSTRSRFGRVIKPTLKHNV